MILIITSTIAISLYLICGFILGLSAAQKKQVTTLSPRLSVFAIIAVAAHGAVVFFTLASPNGADLSFFNVSSLIFCFIALISLVTSWRQPIANLLIPVFPLAALSIINSLLFSSNYQPQHFGLGILLHILLSILAYSVITIATIQSIALAMQDRLLKQRKFNSLLQSLPPLQTMEVLLFQMIGIGVFLLSGSIVTGFLFVDNLFAQHLIDKTLLSLLAWALFSILLWGRYQKGWRSTTATRWTITGFIFLMLAYFGSKFILEFIA